MRKAKIKKQKKCLYCNKDIRRVNWYYRNNEYYCNKNHYKKHLKKLEKENEKN